MLQTRIANAASLCVAFVLIEAGRTGAQPVLLAEYTQSERNGTFQFSNTLPDGVPFNFKAGLAYWIQSFSDADIGQTFEAPTDTVQSLQEAWTLDYTFGGAAGTGATIFSGSLDYWLNKPPGQPPPDTFSLLVPDITDYRLTGFTRSVDSLNLDWIQEGQIYVDGGGQTFRFYGVIIPEPTTWMMFIII